MTIEEFVTKYGLSLNLSPANSNPWVDMPPGAKHWECTLIRGGEHMTFTLSVGPAYTRPPSIHDVLWALGNDAAGIEAAPEGFDGWAAKVGVDPDSRRMHSLYNATCTNKLNLERVLGPKAYRELIDEVR